MFDGFAKGIASDYMRPLADVYRDVCCAHLQSYDELSFLRFCQIDLYPSGMPSWVPNWSSIDKKTVPMGFATGTSAASGITGIECSIRGSDLHIRGLYCGVVEVVGEMAPLVGSLKDVFQS
jgi:hypothetical protein